MTHSMSWIISALLVAGTSSAAFAQTAAAPSTTAEVPPAAVEHQAARPDLIVTGSFFTRYELRQNYNDVGLAGGRIGELDAFAYRARLGLATTPIDIGENRAVILSMTPQASGFWGVTSGGLNDAAVGVHTASLRVQSGKSWFEAGRFEMAYGDHLVVGNVGWHETGRAFDGGRLRVAVGDRGAWIDGFITQVAEGAPALPGLGDGDGFFVGTYAALGPSVAEGMELDGYLFGLVFPATDDGDPMTEEINAVEVTLGARIEKPFGRITVHGEAGIQAGKRPVADESVLAFHLDAGAWFRAGARIRVGASGFFASGDDPDTARLDNWNQLFPTAHKFLGLMDIMGGRSNIAGGTGKVRLEATDKLDLAADAHAFLRPQTPDGVDRFTGLEADLWAGYRLGKGLGLRGQYSAFLANDSGPLATDSLVHYLEVQVKYDLK